MAFDNLALCHSGKTRRKPPKSYEKPTSPLPLKMRGLYRRGKIYWFEKMVNVARTRTCLGTENQDHSFFLPFK
jgi:hypothetical protein